MRTCVVLALAMSHFACADLAVRYREAATPDGLRQVPLPGVRFAFAGDQGSLSGFSSVRFEEGSLSYRELPRLSRRQRALPLGPAATAELSSSEEAFLWRHLRDVFTRELLARSDFALAAGPGQGTLTVRAHVLDLVAYRASRSQGAVSRFTRRSPTFTIVLDVRDSQTDEALARIVDRRTTMARNGVTRQIGHTIDSSGLRQQAKRWARALRVHLQRLRDTQTSAP